MQRSDFSFYLPQHLIAQSPAQVRGADRLLVMSRTDGSFCDDFFSSLPHLLPPNALLVFNNSKVRHARVYGRKEGAESNDIEFLFISHSEEGKTWKVLSPKMRRLKVGDCLLFGDEDERFVGTLQDESKTGDKLLCFLSPLPERFFEKFGHVPLPPYIKREDGKEDARRYQTVYASRIGSIAAPTAGLHFTENILDELKSRGIGICYLTLHVGLGTFLPVREEKIEDHKMHWEEFEIAEDVANTINEAKREGRPIIACGTTSVRTLEAAWYDARGGVKAGRNSTNIFIYPPYHFNVVDGIITNFHTPESTLLMLVSAFCGRERILKAYEHAVKEEYKFFSYGDAMLIL